MNRMSKLSGDGIGKLKLFTEENFGGESKDFTDNDANIQKTWKKSIKSIIVTGNPWLLFPETQYKGMCSFLEEGRYPDLSAFPNMKSNTPGSVRFMADDLGSPEISLYSSSSFAGESEFQMLDPQDQMKCISVGEAGIWAVRAKDETVWVRMHEQNGKPTKKLGWDEAEIGEGWARISGTLRQLSVGSVSVWGVKSDNSIIVRIGISPESPHGTSWAAVDGDKMRQVSVSSQGHVWAVDANDKIWMRKGATNATVLGTGWKMLPGNLKQISVGQCGVWGINAEQQVWFRINTYGDPDNEGTGWQRIEGRFQQVFSGPNGVIALAGNRDLYHRVNMMDDVVVGEKAMGPNNEGTHWVRIEQEKEKKIIFKQVETSGDHIWALDKDNHVFFKSDCYYDINPHYSATLFGDEEDFELHNFPEKATTLKAASGGWVLYSEPGFKGKVLYQMGSESIGNDPNNKDNGYKSWIAAVGSARPIRGQNYRTPVLKMTMDWDAMNIESAQ